MGILQKLSSALGVSKEMDLEEYLDAAELEEVDVLHQAADFYVKPVALESEADVKIIIEELKQRNIILLNVSPMSRMPSKLKSIIEHLKTYIAKSNGDVARIDNEKILLTPSKVKIVKHRRK